MPTNTLSGTSDNKNKIGDDTMNDISASNENLTIKLLLFFQIGPKAFDVDDVNIGKTRICWKIPWLT